MCMGGGGSAKVETPKPPPLPPPLPAPPPPPPVARKQQAKRLEIEPDAKATIKIGSQKRSSTTRASRSSSGERPTSSLSIGDTQGMRL